jgi:hypothetical protein
MKALRLRRLPVLLPLALLHDKEPRKMANMNVFEGDAFSLMAMSRGIDKVPYTPGFLGSLGIFTPEPVRHSTVWVDVRENGINLIQTSPRGAPPDRLEVDTRKAVAFKVPRLAKADRMTAFEVANIRAFGTETDAESVVGEVVRRQARLRNDIEYTQEHMRLAAIQGLLLDADGSTIYDYYTQFGITPPADAEFDFTDDTADFPKFCRDVKRDMARASKGALGQTATVHALAGDAYFDAIVQHPSVTKLWLNWQASAELRGIDPFSQFSVGGITFHNYRGSDDNTTVAVDPEEAHFFPIGGNDVFTHIMAPADEYEPFIGAPGQNVYSWTLPDYTGRQAWRDIEVFSYPLIMCKRPEVLRKGVFE